jgi:ABC-type molybdate transport system substrate-binding protein
MNFKALAFIALLATLISSCTTINKSMREPNNRVQFSKSDFTLSDQLTAEANTTRVFGIDFARIFTKKTGNIEAGGSFSSLINLASLPVVGGFVSGDKTVNYSLYEMMNANPGYDVVFYPTYEIKVVKPIIGIGFILKTTHVKSTARLGKLNK